MIELNCNLPCTLELTVGIDGLTISKNPPSQLWPILGYFSNLELNKFKVFIIGAYYDSDEFLQYFVNELYDLINIGVVSNNTHFKVILKALICDTPAKSYILNVKGHTGKKSCLIYPIFWNGGIKRHNLTLPHNLISSLDNKLNDLGHYILEEIQRAPNVNNASRWKAIELCKLLLYTGMVVLHGIVNKEVYDNFMQFCIDIRILSTKEYIDYAKSLIHSFVSLFAHIYRRSYMSHNVHIISYLADDFKKFGPLDNFSAFPFESYMQPLKKKSRVV
ncbi:Uncharacterized protein FWK35_00028053 [Aphis craccivora]|uniref:Uncharacterized protein n=1 Tax=Aphis craccivora TaxID=307492 RepID=A0A6G0VZ86_APHCR|nr:Uncharacterized protein FWK35_00028053 [Aphis craccivora]